MEELKPCPFCGGTPLLNPGPYDWDCGGRYYYSASIECACGLTLEVDNPGPKVYTDDDGEALGFAIDAWNTRVERTCRNVDEYADAGFFTCGACGFGRNGIELTPNYCPACGAKVIGGVSDD